MNKYNNNDDHSRTIVHIDIDCFYAQVEMIKNSNLCNVPLGIQQKSIVVTCNYIARSFGIQKCMPLTEAVQRCPSLVLINGEDLFSYRRMSYQITTYLQRFSTKVERLGLDENYVDITDLVADRFRNFSQNETVTGYVFNYHENNCLCGCSTRLTIGSHIAQEMREGLINDLKLTSCAGIAHNKLLSKIASSVNKPNNQTTVFPNMGLELLSSLNDLSRIPGIGVTTLQTLNQLQIRKIEDLRSCNIETLELAFDEEKARLLMNFSFGRDFSEVKPSGKPHSIGLEDSCKLTNVESEIESKFQHLLQRLICLVNEDERIPATIKVTVRKNTDISKISHRESRQCSISPILFTVEKNSIHLNQSGTNKLMATIMRLFRKMINTSSSYHITLLGLSFTKFEERVRGKNSIASYFIHDVSVQSITNIENRTTNVSNSSLSRTNSSVDESEAEIEPSPKKSKFASVLLTAHNLADSEISSPSKLNVANLKLNESDIKHNDVLDFELNISCPPSADESVFQQLPTELQKELWNDWKTQRGNESLHQFNSKKFKKNNTLYNYFARTQ